jgi:hypothetical protein
MDFRMCFPRRVEDSNVLHLDCDFAEVVGEQGRKISIEQNAAPRTTQQSERLNPGL